MPAGGRGHAFPRSAVLIAAVTHAALARHSWPPASPPYGLLHLTTHPVYKESVVPLRTAHWESRKARCARVWYRCRSMPPHVHGQRPPPALRFRVSPVPLCHAKYTDKTLQTVVKYN
ncbi:unnamed protein product [Pieris macdunnoughi]|uniref:Secreted protein n=1 Tax=Pieris macdunnoughi TaxID=345717 RepID=A0A821MNY3_9NEOP|nr:unnamed protein product [Pieris macdunnoughi]